MRDALFIWVPKAAGMSIAKALETVGMRTLITKEAVSGFDNKGMVTFSHMSIESLREAGIVQNAFLKRAFKFAFVRNPWDRAVSAFFYYRKIHKGNNARARRQKRKGPREWIWTQRKNIKTFDGFIDAIATQPIPGVGFYNRRGFSQLNSQVRWLISSKGEHFADFIGKYETLDADWRTVCSALKIDFISLPKINTTEHQNYRHYYTAKTRDAVGQIYREDIREFKYDF